MPNKRPACRINMQPGRIVGGGNVIFAGSEAYNCAIQQCTTISFPSLILDKPQTSRNLLDERLLEELFPSQTPRLLQTRKSVLGV